MNLLILMDMKKDYHKICIGGNYIECEKYTAIYQDICR